MLYPYLVRPQQAAKIDLCNCNHLFYMIAGAIFLEGALGSGQVARLLYPLLSFARLIKAGVFRAFGGRCDPDLDFRAIY